MYVRSVYECMFVCARDVYVLFCLWLYECLAVCLFTYLCLYVCPCACLYRARPACMSLCVFARNLMKRPRVWFFICKCPDASVHLYVPVFILLWPLSFDLMCVCVYVFIRAVCLLLLCFSILCVCVIFVCLFVSRARYLFFV